MWVAAADGWQGGGKWRGSQCPHPHAACCLWVSPGHMPGGATQAGTLGGVPCPCQPPRLDTGYSLSGCRLIRAVLCDTTQQLSPLPQGGRAVWVLYCLWEVATWFGGQLCWDLLLSGFICSILCPLGGHCQNQSRTRGVLAWPCSRRRGMCMH